MGDALNAWCIENARRHGPISIDKIEANLFLGGLAAAIDCYTMKVHEITHILTIDTVPLREFNSVELSHIVKKFVQLADQPNEDLLSHFDDTYNFISSAVENGGTVFVHCYFGVSRSASVVIAYLMKKYQIDYEEASKRVKSKRSIICPNRGFVSQLVMYKEMGFTLDNTYMRYKKFRLSIAAYKVRMTRVLPQEFHVLIKPDPEQMQSKPDPNVYRCRKCRRILASESNLITHKFEDGICKKMLFFEPIAWMNVTNITEKKLNCPNCNSKVGSCSWTSGAKCPCGAHQAPAFYLIPSKVDFSNAVKNVEMTV